MNPDDAADPRGPARSSDRASATRSRLIEAAGPAFAENGFKGANLRDICAAADANLGAVRYYFGGKMELYREVLFAAFREVAAGEAEELGKITLEPEAALRRWIDIFLRIVLYRRSRHPYMSRMLALELAHPTGVIDDLARAIVGPVRDGLREIVARLTGQGARTQAVTEKANMIVFLCLQFEVMRPILERLGPPIPDTLPQVGRLATRIADFALGGIRGEV